MLGGPKSELTAKTSTPGEATAFAAAPIFAVIEAVVLGLTTMMRMRKVPDCVASAPTSSCLLRVLCGQSIHHKGHQGARRWGGLHRPTNLRPNKDAGRARP